jgi:flavodoxin
MKSLVVYESWFGNTRALADEIAGVLAQDGDVYLVSVDDPRPPLDDVDLLVVGAPTHVHGLSSRRSREGAVEQGGQGDVGVGVRGWIEALPDGAAGPRVAVFDTRANKPVLLVGSAARGLARRLRKRGYTLAADPESFFVLGTPGPLEEGELERAAEWAGSLAQRVTVPA